MAEITVRGCIGEKCLVGKSYDVLSDRLKNVMIVARKYRPFLVEEVVNAEDEKSGIKLKDYLKFSNVVLAHGAGVLGDGQEFMLMYGVRDEDGKYPELELSGNLTFYPEKKKSGMEINLDGTAVIDESSYALLEVTDLKVFSMERKRRMAEKEKGGKR